MLRLQSTLRSTLPTLAAMTLLWTGCEPLPEECLESTVDDVETALDVTTINGAVVPGELRSMQDSTTMLDTLDANGNRLLVTRGTREAGTRVGIHVHKYGGHTCVMTGEITDFIEGEESSVYPAGTCYYMPPNVLMAAANLGTEDAVLIDNFTLPEGEPVITFREPGYPP